MSPPHPAKFSKVLLPGLQKLLPEHGRVLDPMAGVGTIQEFVDRPFCVEIELPWAQQCGPLAVNADATQLPYPDGVFACVCTSCTYGNRMADHFQPRDSSRRYTYRQFLGQELHPNNTGRMQWGPRYRHTSTLIWQECYRVLERGGILVLNVSDHIRNWRRVRVSAWHLRTLKAIGFQVLRGYNVATERIRHGENSSARMEHEHVFVLLRP